ncbi:MAG: hypothetical protein HOG08_00070, partial [Candidatus Magasanikbacteria bacterium]|nr:hypothetical protein [Candidatus Magasanikbacteria bacterium]
MKRYIMGILAVMLIVAPQGTVFAQELGFHLEVGGEEVTIEELTITTEDDSEEVDISDLQLYIDGEPVDSPVFQTEETPSEDTYVIQVDMDSGDPVDSGEVFSMPLSEMTEGNVISAGEVSNLALGLEIEEEPSFTIEGENYSIKYDGTFDSLGNYYAAYTTNNRVYVRMRDIDKNWADAELLYDYSEEVV